MPTISFTATDEQIAYIIAALDNLYGAAVAGMTRKEKYLYHIRASLGPAVKGIKRREVVAPAIQAEEAARLAAEAALATERQARLNAETQADAAALAIVGGIT